MAILTIKELVNTISNLVSTTLNGSENWCAWNSQITSAVALADIIEVLDGTNTCPEKYTTTTSPSTTERVINSAYTRWQDADKSLKSCLLATISTPLVTEVSNLVHAHQVYSLLFFRYTVLSQSQSFQLREKLDQARLHEYSSMEEFLEEIKKLAGKLTLANDPVNDTYLCFTIIKSLPSTYSSLKTHVRARTTPITFEQLSSLLISEEINIKSEAKVASQISPNDPLTAYPANTPYQYGNYNTRGRTGNYRGRSYNNNGGRFHTNQYQQNNGGLYNNRGARGRRGGGRNWNYRGGGGGGRTGQRSNYNQEYEQYCWYCNRNNHNTSNCFFKDDHPPQAHAASSESTQDYLLDSGANNHVTRDFSNMNTHIPYHGNNSLTVGNGRELQIQGQQFQENPSYGPM